MKVLCFGSLNIDYTYRVGHFVAKGETLAADSLQIFSGGKGLNQSIALARAGAETYHAGAVGADGLFLLEQLREAGVRTGHIRVLEHERTGCAIIQNDAAGDNCILLYGGANRAIRREQADDVLKDFSQGDFLILQNEISEIPYIMEQAHARGMRVVLNPSPMEESLLRFPLDLVDYFILNEVEAGQLLGRTAGAATDLAGALAERFPDAAVILTLGEAGAVYCRGAETVFQPACKARTVDTTAAGDTFTGFFFGALLRGRPVGQAMQIAAQAAALAVERPGAAPSIPVWDEVVRALDKNF